MASFPLDGHTQNELIRKVDLVLDRVKTGGRNFIRQAYEERLATKTAHYTQIQLERLGNLAEERGAGKAELLREALDDLLAKYGVPGIER